LLAGLELAVRDVNDAGGIVGRPLELVVRDTAADPQRAAAAVDELAGLGVAALAGEYHSVVARAAAARADALGLPFLCSSAVLDALTEQPTEWVARLAPAQSHVRRDQRLAKVMIGAPAGQPEFAEWATLLGDDSAAIPFLRYLPERLSPLGARVEAALRERLADAPSFVAFEGYDTVAVLADALRPHGADRARTAESWPRVAVEGTRGQIQFSRTPGVSVWQWAWAPIQVVVEIRRNPIAFGSSTPAESTDIVEPPGPHRARR
jgi:ABC-type branched-subunit amino acid transport system substrate-binding protein